MKKQTKKSKNSWNCYMKLQHSIQDSVLKTQTLLLKDSIPFIPKPWVLLIFKEIRINGNSKFR